jgi:hypothetical protein
MSWHGGHGVGVKIEIKRRPAHRNEHSYGYPSLAASTTADSQWASLYPFGRAIELQIATISSRLAIIAFIAACTAGGIRGGGCNIRSWPSSQNPTWKWLAALTASTRAVLGRGCGRPGASISLVGRPLAAGPSCPRQSPKARDAQGPPDGRNLRTHLRPPLAARG